MQHYRSQAFTGVLVLAVAGIITIPEGRAQPASDGRNLVFYFDISTMSKDDQARAISTAEMIIQRKAQADDRLAVMVFSGNEVAVKQDLTKDGARVLEAMRHIAENPVGSASGNRLSAMAAAMSAAEPIPGRKALFYFASAVGPVPSAAELKPLRDRAANAQVEFYSIDMQGTPAR